QSRRVSPPGSRHKESRAMRHVSREGPALACVLLIVASAAACSSSPSREPWRGSSEGGVAGSSSGSSGSSGSSSSGSSGGGGGGAPYAAARQACVDYMNKLRATLGRPPYARWTANEACTDTQAK